MNDLFTLVYEQAIPIGVTLACLYVFLAFAAWRGTLQKRRSPHFYEQLLLISALCLHVLVLLATLWLPSDLNHTQLALGFAQALSLACCVGVGLLMIEERWVDVYALRSVSLLFPAGSVLLALLIPANPVQLPHYAALHIVVAIAAHGIALVACAHALLLVVLNRLLKRQHMQRWMTLLAEHCPALVVLERVLIRLSIWTGSLLAITVLLGMHSGAMRFDHKTLLTILSLLAWCAVWWGYERRGWRAQKLSWAVWVATGLLLLAYIGSRFVLQAILHRI